MSALIRNTRGAIAVEFAIIVPAVLAMLLSMADVSGLVTANHRLQNVASTIAQLVSESTTGSVNYADLEFAASSTMILYPAVLANSFSRGEGWSSVISITISSVVFKQTNPQCTTGCAYYARVAWSGGNNPRPCGVNLTAAADNATPSPTTLPTDLFGPGSVIVADVVYTYTPAFLTFASMKFYKSAYFAPRYVPPSTYISYTVSTGDDGYASSCPGY